jgi:hypothetical protein
MLVDENALMFVEGWAKSSGSDALIAVPESETTPWGGDAVSRLRRAYERIAPEGRAELEVSPMQEVSQILKDVSSRFSHCSEEFDHVGWEEVTVFTAIWNDLSVPGHDLGGVSSKLTT